MEQAEKKVPHHRTRKRRGRRVSGWTSPATFTSLHCRELANMSTKHATAAALHRWCEVRSIAQVRDDWPQWAGTNAAHSALTAHAATVPHSHHHIACVADISSG